MIHTVDEELYHGVTQLIQKCIGCLFLNPIGADTAATAPTTNIVFRGRSRAETKRALLRYWSEHRGRLNMDLDEFQRRCAQVGDTTIVFQPYL